MFKTVQRKFLTSMAIAVFLILFIIYLGVTNGMFDIPVYDVFSTMFGFGNDPDFELVLFKLRLPRIIIGALVGAGLALAGLVLQGISRNDLADPGILGINAGAGAAILVFVFYFHWNVGGLESFAMFSMPLFALIGGLFAAVFLYMFTWKKGRLDSERFILVGIGLNFGLDAIALYFGMKLESHQYEKARAWLSGSIWNANWDFVLALLPWLLVFIPIIWWRATVLDLFQLDENGAKNLGVSVNKEKGILLFSCVALVSACVAVSGGISFVGLLAPHIAKTMVGIKHKLAIPITMLIGMVLVLGSDFIARTIVQPAEIPSGVVLSIVGVPYFVYLLYKSMK
ncbi:iron ABC transporter permease [Bacillus cereus group sp. BfR-BA-01310]|uniref:FecCD family ABC transporter permease n=1 Tax=Bacillus cereus group sp. BfR-BA-01310 TaxID=2920287 RepID=UPI001F565DF6|nr:iron ABC transporter permease [Bacillus cereus group sp. BfR-BA-01310]